MLIRRHFPTIHLCTKKTCYALKTDPKSPAISLPPVASPPSLAPMDSGYSNEPYYYPSRRNHDNHDDPTRPYTESRLFDQHPHDQHHQVVFMDPTATLLTQRPTVWNIPDPLCQPSMAPPTIPYILPAPSLSTGSSCSHAGVILTDIYPVLPQVSSFFRPPLGESLMYSRQRVYHTQPRPRRHLTRILQAGDCVRKIADFTTTPPHANWCPKRLTSLQGTREGSVVFRPSSFLSMVKKGFASPMRWKGNGLALTVEMIGLCLGMIALRLRSGYR